MRVVLDTNIFISALITPSGPPGLLLKAWTEQRFDLLSHQLQLDELRAVTRRPRFQSMIRRFEAGKLVNDIGELALMPTKLPRVQRSADPNDDFLLALCEAGRADFLVTGDKADLLTLGAHGATHIITAAVFARELGLAV